MSEPDDLALRGLDAEQQERLRRAARRSAPWLVLAVVLVALSVPAIFDLKGLLLALGALCGVLGVLTAGFTWFDRP